MYNERSELWNRATALAEQFREGGFQATQVADEAIRTYRQLLESDACLPEGWFALGTLLHHRRDEGAAASALREAIRLSEEPPADYFFNLGLVLQSSHDWRGAEEAFQEAVGRAPGDADAIENLGIALARQGRHDESQRWFRRALDLSPTTETYLNLELALSRLGHWSEAEEVVRKGLARDQKSSALRLALAEILIERNRLEEALSLAAQDHRSHPSEQSALTVAKAYALLGRRDEAIPLLHEAVRLSSTAWYPLGVLGVVSLQLERAGEALQAFERALASPPSDADDLGPLAPSASTWRAWLQAGRAAALSALGRHQDALQRFQAALTEQPDVLRVWPEFMRYFDATRSELDTPPQR